MAGAASAQPPAGGLRRAVARPRPSRHHVDSVEPEPGRVLARRCLEGLRPLKAPSRRATLVCRGPTAPNGCIVGRGRTTSPARTAAARTPQNDLVAAVHPHPRRQTGTPPNRGWTGALPSQEQESDMAGTNGPTSLAGTPDTPEPPRWGTAQRQGEGRQAKRRADGRAAPGQGPAGPERGRLTPAGVPSRRSSDANPRTGSRLGSGVHRQRHDARHVQPAATRRRSRSAPPRQRPVGRARRSPRFCRSLAACGGFRHQSLRAEGNAARTAAALHICLAWKPRPFHRPEKS